MQKHGFLRGSTFEIISTEETSIFLRFSSNEKTLAVFPFDFDFDAEYSLYGNTLRQRLTVKTKAAATCIFPSERILHFL